MCMGADYNPTVAQNQARLREEIARSDPSDLFLDIPEFWLVVGTDRIYLSRSKLTSALNSLAILGMAVATVTLTAASAATQIGAVHGLRAHQWSGPARRGRCS